MINMKVTYDVRIEKTNQHTRKTIDSINSEYCCELMEESIRDRDILLYWDGSEEYNLCIIDLVDSTSIDYCPFCGEKIEKIERKTRTYVQKTRKVKKKVSVSRLVTKELQEKYWEEVNEDTD
jgi:hypothetical protein